MKNQLRETFKIIRKPEYRIYWAIVAICGFVFALGLALLLRRYFHFEFHDRLGIVGWVSVNKYPKQQEMFYYVAALVFMPMFTAFCWFLWMAYSAATAVLTQNPVQRILKQSAFSYIPLLFVLKDLFRPELSVGQLLWIPIGLVVIAKVGLLFYNFIRSKRQKNERQISRKGGKRARGQGGKRKKNEKQEPIYTIRKSSNLTSRLLINAAGTVLAAGLCIGFYVLIVYPPDSPTFWHNLKILLITTFGALAFWCAYSLFINRIRHRRFQDALADDAYAYVPAVLLLAISVFYPSGQLTLLILFAFGFVSVKVFALLTPQRLDKLHPNQLAWRLLSYLMIPALFYVLLYGKGSVHWELDLFHEGERLAPLNELLRGEIPFRGIYIQHGLFQNAYRPLLASKLFGETLASVRFLEGLFGPLGYVCVYLLGLQVFKSRLTAILAVFIVSGEEFWVSDRHSIFLVNVALVANYITKQHDRGLFAGWRPIVPLPLCSLRSPTTSSYGREIVASCLAFGWKLILAGIVTSLAFFYSTEMGVYAFITCGLFLFLLGFTQKGVSGRKRPLPILCYIAGVFLGALPFVVYFGLHSALDDLVRNSYVQLVYQIPTWGLQFPPLSSFLVQLNAEGLKSFQSETFRWYLPVLLYLIAATYLLHPPFHPPACGGKEGGRGIFWSSESSAKLLLLLLAGITLFRTALGRSDSPHLIYGATMMWFIWIFFLERGILWIWHRPEIYSKVSIPNKSLVYQYVERNRHIPKIIVKSVCVLMPLVMFFWYISTVHHPVKVAKDRLTSLTQYRSIPRNVPQTLERTGGIQLPENQVSQVQQVVKYIQSNTYENDTIFDFSSQGAYYFFANRKSATRYHQIAYAATKSMQEEVIRDLDKSQTKLVILGTGGWFDNIDGVLAPNRHQLIAKYLEEHYQEAVNINGTIILNRKESHVEP